MADELDREESGGLTPLEEMDDGDLAADFGDEGADEGADAGDGEAAADGEAEPDGDADGDASEDDTDVGVASALAKRLRDKDSFIGVMQRELAAMRAEVAALKGDVGAASGANAQGQGAPGAPAESPRDREVREEALDLYRESIDARVEQLQALHGWSEDEALASVREDETWQQRAWAKSLSRADRQLQRFERRVGAAVAPVEDLVVPNAVTRDVEAYIAEHGLGDLVSARDVTDVAGEMFRGAGSRMSVAAVRAHLDEIITQAAGRRALQAIRGGGAAGKPARDPAAVAGARQASAGATKGEWAGAPWAGDREWVTHARTMRKAGDSDDLIRTTLDGLYAESRGTRRAQGRGR